MKTCVLLLSFLVASLCTSTLACAWWSYLGPGKSPTHSYLALLSRDTISSYNFLPSVQVAKALASGANDPDKNKKLDHEATFRVENTLCAAVKEYFFCNDKEMAVRRLAIGFHYLADNADPTDRTGEYKNKFRKIAHDMLVKGKFKQTGVWQKYVAFYRSELKQFNGRIDVDQLVKEARKKASSSGKRLRQAGEKYHQILQNSKTVQDELIRVFAFIKVYQDRMAELFMEELRNGEVGQCSHTKNALNKAGQELEAELRSMVDEARTLYRECKFKEALAILNHALAKAKCQKHKDSINKKIKIVEKRRKYEETTTAWFNEANGLYKKGKCRDAQAKYRQAKEHTECQKVKDSLRTKIIMVQGRLNTRQCQGQDITNRCKQYAQTAVSQNQINVSRSCGYTGARWSNDYQGHYNWCFNASQNAAHQETEARKKLIDNCGFGRQDPKSNKCRIPPSIKTMLQATLIYHCRIPYGCGERCATSISDFPQSAGYNNVRDTGKPCFICPTGYGKATYKGSTVCVKCPKGKRYKNNCCH